MPHPLELPVDDDDDHSPKEEIAGNDGNASNDGINDNEQTSDTDASASSRSGAKETIAVPAGDGPPPPPYPHHYRMLYNGHPPPVPWLWQGPWHPQQAFHFQQQQLPQQQQQLHSKNEDGNDRRMEMTEKGLKKCDGRKNYHYLSVEQAAELRCKCKKTACLQKYCECYSHDVSCGHRCRCIGCENIPKKSNSKKKKKNANSNGDNAEATHCTCQKTKCLKLYCECFANQRYCLRSSQGESIRKKGGHYTSYSCLCSNDCQNLPQYESQRKNTVEDIVKNNPNESKAAKIIQALIQEHEKQEEGKPESNDTDDKKDRQEAKDDKEEAEKERKSSSNMHVVHSEKVNKKETRGNSNKEKIVTEQTNEDKPTASHFPPSQPPAIMNNTKLAYPYHNGMFNHGHPPPVPMLQWPSWHMQPAFHFQQQQSQLGSNNKKKEEVHGETKREGGPDRENGSSSMAKKEEKKSITLSRITREDGDSKKSVTPPSQRPFMMITASLTGSTFNIVIPPGWLGLTLRMMRNSDGDISEGAIITRINPQSMLRGKVNVEDVILSVNGKAVTAISDLKVGQDKVRNLKIVTAGKDMTSTDAAVKAMAPKKYPDGCMKSEQYQEQCNIIEKEEEERRSKEEERNRSSSPPPPRKRVFNATYPTLDEIGALSNDDPTIRHKRQLLLKELLRHEKAQINDTVFHTGRRGASNENDFRVVCIPLKRIGTDSDRKCNKELDEEGLNNLAFGECNNYYGTMDKILSSLASYCDGTKEDAASMMLFHLAKHYPQCYVKNVQKPKEDVTEVATKKKRLVREGAQRYSRYNPVKLPLDFVSYDGTSDIAWNAKYGELLKFKEEFGHLKVYTKSELGCWVTGLRKLKHVGHTGILTEKRVELLDNIGFLWSGLKEGQSRPNPRGQLKLNRAIAAKIHYPQLTIRECLHLGGYKDEELNIIPNEKFSWRTKYVDYKDRIMSKVKLYDSSFTAKNKVSWADIHKFVPILEGGGDDRFEQVFGDCAHLLPEFLEAAEERTAQGIVQKDLRGGGGTKRRREEAGAATENEKLQPSKKRAMVEVAHDSAKNVEEMGNGSSDDEKLYTKDNDVDTLDHTDQENTRPSDEEAELLQSEEHTHLEFANEPLEPADMNFV